MSKQIDLGEIECWHTCGDALSTGGRLFEASLESDNPDVQVNVDWYCTDESNLLPFAKGQRYRVILERIDG